MSVVHVKSKVPGAVYIGRGSPWGNPFYVGRSKFATIDTLGLTAYPAIKVASREEAIERYRLLLWQQIKARAIDLADLARSTASRWRATARPRPATATSSRVLHAGLATTSPRRRLTPSPRTRRRSAAATWKAGCTTPPTSSGSATPTPTTPWHPPRSRAERPGPATGIRRRRGRWRCHHPNQGHDQGGHDGTAKDAAETDPAKFAAGSPDVCIACNEEMLTTYPSTGPVYDDQAKDIFDGIATGFGYPERGIELAAEQVALTGCVKCGTEDTGRFTPGYAICDDCRRS